MECCPGPPVAHDCRDLLGLRIVLSVPHRNINERGRSIHYTRLPKQRQCTLSMHISGTPNQLNDGQITELSFTYLTVFRTMLRLIILLNYCYVVVQNMVFRAVLDKINPALPSGKAISSDKGVVSLRQSH